MQIDIEFNKYLDQLMEFTGITPDELFDKCYDIYGSSDFSAAELLQIATNLKVDPILLWQKKIDFEVLKSTYQGSIILPKCYTEVCTSKMISLQNVLEQYKKYDLYEYALKRLQINEKSLSEKKSISILSINDIFSYSSGFFTKQDYEAITLRNASFTYNNIVKKEISANQSKIKKAEKMFELICFFEQNWTYQIIKSDLNSITIGTSESERMRSATTYRPFTNHITTFGRFSFFKQVFGLMGEPIQGVTTNSSWSNREKSFSFTVDLY